MAGKQRRRGLFDCTPSVAEADAQRWHDEAKHTEVGCWCCCQACPGANPHRQSAQEAVVIDVFQRIKESQGPLRRDKRTMPGEDEVPHSASRPVLVDQRR